MSFTPFTFTYDPPPTVESDAAVLPITNPTSSNGSNTNPYTTTVPPIPANSVATSLVTTFNNLAETSTYLQSIINQLSSSIAVPVDTTANPNVGQALTTIYGSIPPAISIAMYNNLLDADVNIQLTNAALGLNASSQVNPVQAAAVSTLLTTVESNLSDAVTYATQLPLLLRSLKAESAIFTSLASNLTAYPAQSSTVTNTSATAVITASTIDVSPTVASALTSFANDCSSAYAGVYTVACTNGAVADDLNNVLNTLVNQPLADIVRIVGLVNAATGMVFKDAFNTALKDIGNYVYIQLVADASSMVFNTDIFNQMALSPFSSITGSLGNLLSSIQNINLSVGTMPAGSPMGGMSKINACGCTGTSASPVTSIVVNVSGTSASNAASINSQISALTPGLSSIGTLLNWSQSKISSKSSKILENFQKILGKCVGIVASQTSLLCSLKAAEQLVTIATSITQQVITNPSASPTANIQAISNSISFGSTTPSFISSNNTVVTSVVSAPVPSTNVQSVLTAGGLTSLGVTNG